ncbi:hypothetical protein QJS10_CPA06g00157 [Acorus calamus]|uniref:DUF7811 domain-containing protein n=1 Tax=Acorus calamus TaxID=4465 RepID=A0AAV9EQF9_ACOCL|nr:hypothetical protein QJS10_CPA06g00157 [Acorus calamus]
MAESSATLCFSSTSLPSFPTLPLSRSGHGFPSTSRRISFVRHRRRSGGALVRSKGRDSEGGGEDLFGHYPWESHSGEGIQWVPEDRITLFTAEGLIHIGGSLVPRRIQSLDRKQGKPKGSQRFQRYQESDYMDPNQGLCLGALFDIAATNGLDMGRRLCIFGFCRSIEMLSDVVEDTVLEHGGEVVTAEKASEEGGLQEKLTMTIAVPLLWGVPPASDTLHFAVRSGGGIVEKIYWQWDFL